MLTLPLVMAVLSAGALGGVHCAGMCGGISSMLSRATASGRKIIPIVQQNHATPGSVVPRIDMNQIWLQAGRLTTYMLIGAVAGALGTAGMVFKPYFPVHAVLFAFGNLALILLGLRLLGYLPKLGGLWNIPILNRVGNGFTHFSQQQPFLVGMTWGCLPCGLLYGMLPFAWLSAEAWSGAVLMLAFGLSALPHLLLAQQLSYARRFRQSARPYTVLAALLLIGLGAFGLYFHDMRAMPDFLCVTPLH